MQISVELSKYPLHDEYIEPIKDFIARLNQYPDLKVITNTMSTQVFGEQSAVMAALGAEMQRSWETYGKAIFVCKFINGDLSPQ